MARKKTLEEQIQNEINKQKSAEDELSLLEKLQEDLKKRKAEARRKLKEEKEQEAFVLGKELFNIYKTTDLKEIISKIQEESNNTPSISDENLSYIQQLAYKIRKDEFIPWKEAFAEIEKRF